MEVSDRLRTFCEQGTGKSKKEAEQEAASKVINKLGIGKENGKREKLTSSNSTRDNQSP